MVAGQNFSTGATRRVDQRQFVVTIDGPAGAGKSTTAKALAERLGYTYLDSGALYRAVAWKMYLQRVDLSDERQVNAVLASTTLRLNSVGPRVFVSVDDRDVTPHLRMPEVGRGASLVAAIPSVRAWLLPLQREWGRRGGIVAEGRDMGTQVFPAADVKFYLDADVETRARRRLRDDVQLVGMKDVETVRAELVDRDARDSCRASAPLRPAPDAIVIDTASRSVEQVVEVMVEAIAARL